MSQTDSPQEENQENISRVADPAANQTSSNYELNPSFKATLLYYLYNVFIQSEGQRIDELTHPIILIQIGIIALPAFVTGILSFYGWRKTRKSWHKGKFHNVIYVSLNTLSKRRVTARAMANSSRIYNHQYILNHNPIIEQSIEHMIHNEEGRNQLIKACQNTSEDDPFVKLGTIESQYMVLNQIYNQINIVMSRSANIYKDMMISAMYNQYCDDSNINMDERIASIQSDIDKFSKMDNYEVIGIEDNPYNYYVPGIVSTRYIVALLSKPVEKNNFESNKAINMNKITVFVISKLAIMDILNTFGIDFIRNVAEDEWMSYLDCNFYTKDRWNVIRKIAIVYHKHLTNVNNNQNVFVYELGTAIFETELSGIDYSYNADFEHKKIM